MYRETAMIKSLNEIDMANRGLQFRVNTNARLFKDNAIYRAKLL